MLSKSSIKGVFIYATKPYFMRNNYAQVLIGEREYRLARYHAFRSYQESLKVAVSVLIEEYIDALELLILVNIHLSNHEEIEELWSDYVERSLDLGLEIIPELEELYLISLTTQE
jgi:hypothetical protein